MGFVPQKVSDKLWEEFVQYCNKFFDARKAANGDSHSEEHKNLEHKESILKELKNFIETKAEDASEKDSSIDQRIYQNRSCSIQRESIVCMLNQWK